ncbi:unnamed protein product [Oppiella nova]|uniref:E2 ubiquitin-conjugating enzyme n=1 Tax=Oppiella nova TaxID=334625 RepID=A0A7R9QS12_9ACAR|nr:unnamed protein product [Oppiella nova]CAG2173562.1 unnamed protein product [Oppiella nova]
MAFRRIDKEIQELQTNPIPGITAAPVPPGTNPFEWVGNIAGPPDTPYAGGLFIVRIQFPQNYPFSPPTIKIQTRVFHPNISHQDGHICVDTLSDAWSAALSISKVLLTIQQLLATPNPDDPLTQEHTHAYRTNRQLFNQRAKEWTQLYARPPQPSPSFALTNQSTQDSSGGTGSQ